jgi:HD-GYP domain-containing protein (c-di-GMP phosphodiesterase class II)
LPGELIGPLAKSVVRSHHERWDGGGYPDGLAGEEITEFARLAAVADTFDAVTSERPYRGASPPHVGVRVVRNETGKAFDPQMVEVFDDVVAPYPPGHEIELTDGRRGVTVEVKPGSFDFPLVRVGYDATGRRVDPYELDLREHPELSPSAPRDDDHEVEKAA